MQFMTIHSMQTLQYVPKLDRNYFRSGASWMVAIAASMIGIAAYT